MSQRPRPPIRIVTDSSSDLPAGLAADAGIEIVPLMIRFGDTEFVDRDELTTAEFWARCAASPELPSTAAPAPGRFELAYRRLVDEGAQGIVVPTLSGELSATFQSAVIAAEQAGVDVRVVDSRTVSLGIGTIALACARAAEHETSLDAIESLARDLVGRTRVIGALDTLENLKKGGRIGNARALLGTALSIKPIIEVRNGRVEESGKQRTRTKALRLLVDQLRADAGHIGDLAVLHADCSDVDRFVDMLGDLVDGDIVVGEIGPVVGTHAGRGTIGVAYHRTR